MKQRMQSSAEILATSIGTDESTKRTIRVEKGEEQDMGSQRDVEEMLVHPNVIKNLKVGQAVLLRQQPTKIDLINVKYIDEGSIKRNLDFLGYNGLLKKEIIPETSFEYEEDELEEILDV